MLKTGSVIDGKYKILSEIGHGGMSNVYLAINEKANKPWAVKEVRKSPGRDFHLLQQSLIMETDLLKKLNHPNLPSIIDVIDSDENFLIVMDYIEGNTLERLLAEEGAQPQEKVVHWALQLCDVLNYLHTRETPVIYRDMKPSNIMLKTDGSVILIDFGTARELKEKDAADTVSLGTNGYAAPEQFGSFGMMRKTDARTDIYCLGATLYHLVTGKNPSEQPCEMLPITKWNPELSTGLERIIQRCTRKNPKERYQTAQELRYDLEHYRDLELQSQHKYRRRLVLFAAVLGLSLLCAVSGLGFSIAAEEKQGEEYQKLIHMAKITPDSVDACGLYLDAIAVDESRPEAYQGFCTAMIEDGVFSDAEEELFLKLSISTQQYLQNFQKRNASAYADFCYEMGNIYWYYYEHEENRQSRAFCWFQTALDYYMNNTFREAECRRCQLYVELGTFYKTVIASQIAGTDAGMYGAYWRSLTELKALNDKEPDRDMITLQLYREIATRIVEYADHFMDDGVTGREIIVLLNEVEADLRQMEQDAASAIQQEIEELLWVIEAAHKMVRSTYKIAY